MRGAFTISIDYEYAWGYVDTQLSAVALDRVRKETEITKRLLALFEKYRIPATWAIVGGLLEEGQYGRDTAWYDAEGLVRAIAASSLGHEIASHSFGHILFDAVSEDEALADLQEAQRIHFEKGLPFKTFVFPRNQEGNFGALKKTGIETFRGMSSTWYDFLPRRLWTLGRGIDYWLPTARTVVPQQHVSGLTEIPDSMLFISRKGIQKMLPPGQLVRKIQRGIRKASERGEIFHLWFHPSNFSHDTETQFASFEKILAYAEAARNAGHLRILPMGACKEHYGKR